MVRLLIKRKSNVCQRLRDGRNAMDLAIDNNHEECVLALIESRNWLACMKNATFSESSGIKQDAERLPF